MPTALICSDGGKHIMELMQSLSSLKGWDVHEHNLQINDVEQIAQEFVNSDLHYIIYINHLNQRTLQDLDRIRKSNPWTFIIYYNSHLINQQFLELSKIGINSCIIGIDRKKNLKEYLVTLWSHHWKRIPEILYPLNSTVMPPRAKKIFKYLEDKPVTECTTKKLAEFLKISQSHFRAEFKSHFGLNFREYKQRLFNHYESELLLKKNYKPGDICEILNYKYIANYSRSFKSRHGECWRNIHKEH